MNGSFDIYLNPNHDIIGYFQQQVNKHGIVKIVQNATIVICLYKWVGFIRFGFMTSTIVGYLMPNPFFYI